MNNMKNSSENTLKEQELGFLRELIEVQRLDVKNKAAEIELHKKDIESKTELAHASIEA